MEGHVLTDSGLARVHEQRMTSIEGRAKEDRDEFRSGFRDMNGRLDKHEEKLDLILARTAPRNGTSSARRTPTAPGGGALSFLKEPWWWAIIAVVGGSDLVLKALGVIK